MSKRTLLERLRGFEYLSLEHICCEAADRILELESRVVDVELALESKQISIDALMENTKQLSRQLDAVRDLEPDFADIAVGKTVKVLMYDDVQEALQGESDG